MSTDEKIRRTTGRRKRRTALQARIEYESAHPEIGIMSPLTSRSGEWEVSTAEGTHGFSEVWAMLDFLASLFGPPEAQRRSG